LNIKKAITSFAQKIESCQSQSEAKALLQKTLDSYNYQTRYKVNQIESFINSIYTPTLKLNSEKEAKIKFQTKRNRHEKFRTALRFEEVIKKYRLEKYSDQKIAVILNAQYVHKKDYFSKMYINRFRKERNIK
jgi:hypothetical protein